VLAPEGAAIAIYKAETGREYVSIVAPISLANESNAQEPLLVVKQTARIVIGKREIPLIWHDILEVPINAETGAKFDRTRAVHPFVIDTKKINSELVRFTPQRAPCEKVDGCDPNRPFMSPEAFRDLVQETLQAGTTTAQIDISIDFDNHETVSKSCAIPLMPNHMRLLRDLGYFMELCRAT
jgi:hypothetical protein